MSESMKGKRGIDVSENNGHIDWDAVKEAGIDFAIVRLGYGNCHLDSCFYDNVNGALDAGLDIGVYYYSYALDADATEREAHFLADILKDCGLTMEKLKMGVWFDMEDADGYKRLHYVTDRQMLTEADAVQVVRVLEAFCDLRVARPLRLRDFVAQREFHAPLPARRVGGDRREQDRPLRP